MRRYGLLLLGVLMALQGCASRFEPSPGSVRPELQFAPEGETKAVIIAVHGFNDYSRAFEEFGDYASKRGYLVDAYDQQGFGRNQSNGHWPGAELLAADLIERIDDHRARNPNRSIYVIGESMGAAVAMTALAQQAPGFVEGLILSAPAVWGGDAMNPFYRAVLWVGATVAPGWTFTGDGLGIQASDNVPMLRALGADPLFIKETRLEAIQGLVELMGEAREAGAGLRLPRLLLDGERDQVVEPQVIDSFALTLAPPFCRRITYAEGWHLLLRDLQRERVFNDILRWLADPRAGTIGTACYNS